MGLEDNRRQDVGHQTRSRRDPPRFYDDLDETLAEAWRLLERGVADRRSPFHTPALASLREDGAPSVRTLVLRAVDRDARTLRFHTDVRSGKFREIAAQPRVALHFYDPTRKVQLRIDGSARLHKGDAVAAAAWRATRSFSRACYRVEPQPGQEIDDPRSAQTEIGSERSEAGHENFAAITVEMESLEWLYLAARGHRRAQFRWQNHALAASWLVP